MSIPTASIKFLLKLFYDRQERLHFRNHRVLLSPQGKIQEKDFTEYQNILEKHSRAMSKYINSRPV